MSRLQTLVQKSIERVQAFEPPEGYYFAFSGGKDSIVTKRILQMAGVKFDAHYRITTVDPPELVRFIKEKHPDVQMEHARYDDGTAVTMWNLIPKKLMPPTRLVRYCCQSLKEDGGDGRMTVTGVRWAESVARKKNQGTVTVIGKKAAKELSVSDDFRQTKNGRGAVLLSDNAESRRLIEQCYTRSKTTLNPIIDWTDEEVWGFIRAENIPYCELYDEGFSRLGCIGCPMAQTHGREKEFARWPKYKEAYLRAFQKMLEERERRWKMNGGMRMGNTPESVFNWWMEYDIIPGQLTFDDL